MTGQLLPSMRVCDLLREGVGYELSEDTLYNAYAQCDEQLESVEQQISVTRSLLVSLMVAGFTESKEF